MATNPMQRRARNSFLLGMLITLLVLGAVIAFLVFMMMNMKKTQDELQAETVCVLKADISSGDEINAANLEEVKVSKATFPSNAIKKSDLGEKNVAKVNLKRGTIITADMLYIDATTTGNDVRLQEYNAIVLPMDLASGEFVDIRLMLPSGQDFIVVSKKKVEIPTVGTTDSKDTIKMEMSEEEILSMSNAIVEAYMINGSKLYATRYTDAGNQDAATPTYPVNGEVATLIENDKNIVDKALQELRSRYNRDLRENYINSAIRAEEDAAGNEQTKMQESITNSQTSREEYLQSLTGAAATN